MSLQSSVKQSDIISEVISDSVNWQCIGDEIFETASEIFPICRSIAGEGVRETLRCLSRQVDITIHEVPTGKRVFDWTVPREWNIRHAYIKAPSGKKVVDFAESNLHVLNYSVPVHTSLPLNELKDHIFTLPDKPDLIPYRTAYSGDQWGFCMAHRQLEELPEGIYEVFIDSDIKEGNMTYGEIYHPGQTDDEVLLSAHICHPSLANDNCSGLALLAHLAKKICSMETRLSYRMLFTPGTVGAITWLAEHRQQVHRIKHGVILSCVGDSGRPTYKRSRRGMELIDRAFAHVLQHACREPNIIDFSPYGYDERQYCSPGFNLPVGLFQRSQFGTFPQYHTSADNLDFISAVSLAGSFKLVFSALAIIEGEMSFLNRSPFCEPQLGRRGLYNKIGGTQRFPEKNLAMLWVLNLSDGQHSLLDIAERANLPFELIYDAAQKLSGAGLLSGPQPKS